MNPRQFLTELWEGKPDNQMVLIWSLPDKRSRWFCCLDDAAEAVASLSDKDVYVGVGLASREYGPARRCPSDEVSGLAGFWADFDVHSLAHERKALPGSIDEALATIPREMPPTLVIATGNGAHAWWLFKEPIVFENPDERTRAANLVARWNTLLQLKAAERGWSFDRLADLARVLRIPGTFNHKQPDAPKHVALHAANGRRYNLGDFEELLDALAVPTPDVNVRVTRELIGTVQDAALVVNLGARVPSDSLDGWMAQDLRFRHTWFRQRHDLKDQSQSGYDLALAHFGLEAGLPSQEIVNLIIHHRTLHAQKQRTRVDYFERTIAHAAASRDHDSALPAPPPRLVQPEVGPAPAADTGDGPAAVAAPAVEAADPVAAKAQLCEYISKVLGVRILRIVKVTGKEPTYQLVLENSTVELNSVGKLLDQSSLRLAIATAINRLTNRLKPKAWEQLTQSFLDALTEIESGPETQMDGVVHMYLDQYLADVAFIPRIEGQPSSATRRPMVIDGQIAVNSADLQLFVNKVFLQSLTVKAVSSMLAAIGASNVRIRGMNGREQGRWLLPLSDFKAADYAEKCQWEERSEDESVAD